MITFTSHLLIVIFYDDFETVFTLDFSFNLGGILFRLGVVLGLVATSFRGQMPIFGEVSFSPKFFSLSAFHLLFKLTFCI